nr:MAG TPA: hypothetical protein [Caudoviricetes sp.]
MPLELSHGNGIKKPATMGGTFRGEKSPRGFPWGLHHFILIYCFFKSSTNTATGKKRIARIFTLSPPSFRNHHLLPRLGI